ncbi:GntR family transcriptional regulator [Mycolicibacterium tokaiense]|uniref:GntR family transcriptional regulator n=1 Tax=Mycolicibacterium tokaiense TaxID=39695 RepID=UPI001558E6B2|nr:GntR family transcriptional regulator [Mycolicibacterium tokaiense]
MSQPGGGSTEEKGAASADSSSVEESGYRPMSRDVTASLREAILAGTLGPDQRIGQDAIARQHGVSRVPVREALRQLEAEGLVVQTPHAGARVSSFSLEEVPELYELREALEPLVLRHSVGNLSLDQLDELKASMERVVATENDVQAWLLQDRLFHLSSFQAAGMPTAMNLAERIYNLTQSYRRQFFSSLNPEEMEMSHLEHRLILDAIISGDAEKAAELHRLHVRQTRMVVQASRRHASKNMRSD